MNLYENAVQSHLEQTQSPTPDGLRERILRDVNIGDVAPRKIRRRIGMRTLVVATIVLLSLSTLVGFTYGSRIVQLLSGGIWEDGPNGLKVEMRSGAPDPVEIRDGRIFFVADGVETDITDYCSEETYFQYEKTGDNGFHHVLTIGGTPDNLEWAEFIWDENSLSQSCITYFISEVEPAWYSAAWEALDLLYPKSE